MVCAVGDEKKFQIVTKKKDVLRRGCTLAFENSLFGDKCDKGDKLAFGRVKIQELENL